MESLLCEREVKYRRWLIQKLSAWFWKKCFFVWDLGVIKMEQVGFSVVLHFSFHWNVHDEKTAQFYWCISRSESINWNNVVFELQTNVFMQISRICHINFFDFVNLFQDLRVDRSFWKDSIEKVSRYSNSAL